MSELHEDFNQHLGIQFGSGVDGVFELQLTVEEKHCNEAGRIHGGVYMSLLDTVMSRAIRTLLDEGSFAPTMTLNASFFKSMGTGVVRAEGRVVNQSQGAALVEGRLFGAEDQLLAQGTGFFYVINAVD